MSIAVTRMSRNGQVVIPKPIREKLGLRPGESLIASDVDGRIVLTSARGETIRSEFEKITKRFDKVLAGKKAGLDPVELVRRLRDEGADRE